MDEAILQVSVILIKFLNPSIKAFLLTLLYPGFLGLLYPREGGGGGLFLPAGHNSKLAYAKNFKFVMK